MRSMPGIWGENMGQTSPHKSTPPKQNTAFFFCDFGVPKKIRKDCLFGKGFKVATRVSKLQLKKISMIFAHSENLLIRYSVSLITGVLRFVSPFQSLIRGFFVLVGIPPFNCATSNRHGHHGHQEDG